jgi:hypothetical protein
MQTRSPRRRLRLLSSLTAGFAAACALAVSAYTAYLQREQVRAQVRPIIDVDLNYGPKWFQIELNNRGTGPGVLREVTIQLGETAVSRWTDLVGHVTSGKREDYDAQTTEFGDWSVLAAGEEHSIFTLTAKGEAQLPREFAKQVRVTLCYCSLLEECWRTTNGEPVPVRRCESGKTIVH